MSVPNSSPQGSRNPAEGRMVFRVREGGYERNGLLNTTRPMHIWTHRDCAKIHRSAGVCSRQVPSTKKRSRHKPSLLTQKLSPIINHCKQKMIFRQVLLTWGQAIRVDCMSSTGRARLKELDGILGILCLKILNQGILKVIFIDLYL